MSETKPFEKEDPKEDLRVYAIVTALIGVIALALWGLYYLFYYLVTFTSNPSIYLFSTIGNILENTIGKTPTIVQFAIIFFIIAGILGFGLLLEDEDVREYKALITIIWSITVLIFFAILGASLYISISLPVVIGLLFISFVSPPFVFGILKGFKFLLSRFL
jgi:hypothetical protein